MTRKQALIAIQAAGFENDQQTFLRIYTENRIGYGAAKDAFDLGRRLSAKRASEELCPCGFTWDECRT